MFKANAITYIAGYAINIVKRFLKCDNCLDVLLADNNYMFSDFYKLLRIKDRGGLIVPSIDVVKICSVAENTLNVIDICDEKRNEKLVVYTLRNLTIEKLFVNMVCDTDDDENHKYSLIKLIILSYGKIKFFNKLKSMNYQRSMRNFMTRLIIHKHQ